MIKVHGSDLLIGDAVEVWWAPKTDIITALVPYTGPLSHLFPSGAQIAIFAINKTGMTIDNSDQYRVTRAAA